MAPTINTTPGGFAIKVEGTVTGDYGVDEASVRAALQRTARENGVTVEDLRVTVERVPGRRTYTLTEEEYEALRQGREA